MCAVGLSAFGPNCVDVCMCMYVCEDMYVHRNFSCWLQHSSGRADTSLSKDPAKDLARYWDDKASGKAFIGPGHQ